MCEVKKIENSKGLHIQKTRIYITSIETPYCPNGCNNNGMCDPSTGCKCYYAWVSGDCSICDSSTFCTDHGICETPTMNNRSCSCVTGWGGPACATCDPNVLCSGHGDCDSSTISGQCTCDNGFSGVDCSVCTLFSRQVVDPSR